VSGRVKRLPNAEYQNLVEFSACMCPSLKTMSSPQKLPSFFGAALKNAAQPRPIG
jgi:hypothetical protein